MSKGCLKRIGSEYNFGNTIKRARLHVNSGRAICYGFTHLYPPLYIDIQGLNVDIPGFEVHVPTQGTLSCFIQDLKETLWKCEAPIYVFISDFNPQVNLPPNEVLFKLNTMSKIIIDYCNKNHSNVPDHQCSMSVATQVIMPILGWYPNPTIPAPQYNSDGSPYVNNFSWYIAVNDIIRLFNLSLTGINGFNGSNGVDTKYMVIPCKWAEIDPNDPSTFSRGVNLVAWIKQRRFDRMVKFMQKRIQTHYQ